MAGLPGAGLTVALVVRPQFSDARLQYLGALWRIISDGQQHDQEERRPRAPDQRSGQQLFLWEKRRTAEPGQGTILFVHGSSMASTPGFDLQAPGVDYTSAMDWFAAKGVDCWCCDHRGYGRSYKGTEVLATIADGADDLEAASDYIMAKNKTGQLYVYGISSGALRAALFAERHPERGQATCARCMYGPGRAARRLQSAPRNSPMAGEPAPSDQPRVPPQHPYPRQGLYGQPCASEPFNVAVLALDDLGAERRLYRCAQPAGERSTKITVPTIIMRGQYDGIASLDDLIEFTSFRPMPTRSSRSCPTSRTVRSRR
jgi:alpha-beta hydrolase superfamily lysophospholipase